MINSSSFNNWEILSVVQDNTQKLKIPPYLTQSFCVVFPLKNKNYAGETTEQW